MKIVTEKVFDDLERIVAKSDASFDGRPFKSLGRADRTRYLARARQSVAAVLEHLEMRPSGLGPGAAFNP